MNILQSIFTDYYEPIIYKLHPRPSVIENVNKMIHCGDPSVLTVETNTTSFVLFICPVSLFLVFIAIVKWNPHIHWSIFS